MLSMLKPDSMSRYEGGGSASRNNDGEFVKSTNLPAVVRDSRDNHHHYDQDG
jgi:hypothetical protein